MFLNLHPSGQKKFSLDLNIIILRDDWSTKDVSEPSSFGATKAFSDLDIYISNIIILQDDWFTKDVSEPSSF
jgi:hypothetical protein